MLEAGTKAPEFTLPDKDGNPVSLSDFAGRKVALYFYPRNNTPGRTRQACAFAAGYEEFKWRDREGDAQGKAGYQRRRDPGISERQRV